MSHVARFNHVTMASSQVPQFTGGSSTKLSSLGYIAHTMSTEKNLHTHTQYTHAHRLICVASKYQLLKKNINCSF